MAQTAEHKRLARENVKQWYRWGSYLAARSWGTVRESGSIDDAWKRFPFEHARSRATRWSEDGIGGFSDVQQRLCLSAAFWNGQDPILKERFFGLGNDQGNHGEDLKDYFFFVDGLPSSSYMKMVYRYPQVEFPYQRLAQEDALRGLESPPAQLIDLLPNTFARKRYFDIAIEFAKADADDLLYRLTATNCGDIPAPLHLIPQLFLRNTWGKDAEHPRLRRVSDSEVAVEHPDFDGYCWYVQEGGALLFTENETNYERLFDQPNNSRYTKDGIDYAVVRGQINRVNPDGIGSKCAAHYHAILAPNESWAVRARLSPEQQATPWADFDAIFETRCHEADEFFHEIQADRVSDEDRALERAAYAGLSWNNVFYHFNVGQWLEECKAPDSDEAAEKAYAGWEHFDAHDILSMPDPWEYPWLANWDVSFQIVTYALIDPTLAKQQALTLLSDRYMQANGAIAAFEGDLNTPHPPTIAWAVWHIYQDSDHDTQFLQAAYDPLKRHFGWWLETQRPRDHFFHGGFLGKDNISILDRNSDVPENGWIAQADGAGWMAFFALNLLVMAVELERDDEADYFLGQFLSIRESLQELWNDAEAYYFDELHLPEGDCIPLKIRSMVGLIPLIAGMVVDPARLESLPTMRERLADATEIAELRPNADGKVLLCAVPQDRLKRLLNVLLDPEEFRSPFGLRSLSKYHAEHPVTLKLRDKTFQLEYTPGYSQDNMLGGNSNWRGPIWAPLNQLLIEALYTYDQYFGAHAIRLASGSVSLGDAIRELVASLLSLFKPDEKGYRPYLGANEILQRDAAWHTMYWFHEYFHPETGEGLGAAHQNGWTAVVAALVHSQGEGRLNLEVHQR